MSIFSRLKQQIIALENWYLETPERSLETSYRAALKIKQLEDEHFHGQRIGSGHGHSPATLNYFEAELQKLLKTVRMRLTEFKACNRVINSQRRQPNYQPQRITTPEVFADSSTNSATYSASPSSSGTYTLNQEQFSTKIISNNLSIPSVIEKLQYIDAILQRYRPPSIDELTAQMSPQTATTQQGRPVTTALSSNESNGFKPDSLYNQGVVSDEINPNTKLDSSSFIPRSILRTADRFRRELNAKPETEEEVIKDFRNAKFRTRIALRFVLLLIIVPLLAQQLSKSFIVSPLIDNWQTTKQISQFEQFVNSDIEDKVLKELNQFEARLRFQNLLTDSPPLSEQLLQSQLKARAVDLSNKYRWELTEPIKNIISDLFGLGAFTILVVTGRQKIIIFKSFLDDVIYGLSDSAKAFILILFTDVFVGFHSPHGWTVVMHNVLEHFGLPRNDEFIDVFIATFPVMLDTVFKYWIFRYLNQISPSAVATYRNMNE
jgi:CemA family